MVHKVPISSMLAIGSGGTTRKQEHGVAARLFHATAPCNIVLVFTVLFWAFVHLCRSVMMGMGTKYMSELKIFISRAEHEDGCGKSDENVELQMRTAYGRWEAEGRSPQKKDLECFYSICRS